MEQKQGYPNLDAAKFLCALLVVVIHTSPLKNTSELAHFYLNDVITRVAVPLFFAMSGFLFFRKLDFVDGKIARTERNLTCIVKATRKNVLLYITWALIYLVIVLPDWYRTGWWGLHAVKDWLYSLLFSGTYYHLWYLLALISALPVLYVLLMFIPLERFWLVGAGLWVLECLTYSYSWIGFDQIPLVMTIGNRMPVVFDALFRAVPLLSIGAVCAGKPTKRTSVGLCVVAFLLCAAEASLLYFFSPNESQFSYLFATGSFDLHPSECAGFRQTDRTSTPLAVPFAGYEPADLLPASHDLLFLPGVGFPLRNSLLAGCDCNRGRSFRHPGPFERTALRPMPIEESILKLEDFPCTTPNFLSPKTACFSSPAVRASSAPTSARPF